MEIIYTNAQEKYNFFPFKKKVTLMKNGDIERRLERIALPKAEFGVKSKNAIKYKTNSFHQPLVLPINFSNTSIRVGNSDSKCVKKLTTNFMQLIFKFQL